MDAKEEYLKFLTHLDIVLTNLSQTNSAVLLSEILRGHNINFDIEYVYKVGDKLRDDGYVKMFRDTGGTDLEITPLGSKFIAYGGYVGELKNEQEKEKKEKELIESTIKSNKVNVKLFRWNLGFAILNLILFITNLIIAYFALIK